MKYQWQRHFCCHEHQVLWCAAFDWQTIRGNVFARDNHICVICGYNPTTSKRWYSQKRNIWVNGELSLHCDHIVPISKGGSFYDMANLQTLCKQCHEQKTAEDFTSPENKRKRELKARRKTAKEKLRETNWLLITACLAKNT